MMSTLRSTSLKSSFAFHFKRRLPVVLLAGLCLALTIKFQVLPKSISLTAAQVANAAKVIDIDVGTLNAAMASSAHKLLTFDPFDKILMTDTLERYPYVVSDWTGYANFQLNMRQRGCSTINMINRWYSEALRDQRALENCGPSIKEKNIWQGVLDCADPPRDAVQSRQVPVRRLSDVLNEGGYRRVGRLKLDAQGSDSAILRDVVENCAHIEFSEIRVECQFYDQTVPLYLTDNDCTRIEAYMQSRFPGVRIVRSLNVCWSKEYNLIMTNLTRAK